MRQLLEVVNEAEELPLTIHLLASTQREAIQSFAVSKITEHGFDGREALTVLSTTLGAVDALTHGS